MSSDATLDTDRPSTFNYVLSFLLVGVAWGFTTPFMRRAAADFNARQEARHQQPDQQHPNEPLAHAPAATRDNQADAKEDGILLSEIPDSIGSKSDDDDDDDDDDAEHKPLAGSSRVRGGGSGGIRRQAAAGSAGWEENIQSEEDSEDGAAGQQRQRGRQGGLEPSIAAAPSLLSPSWIKTKLITLFWTVVNLLRTPAYLIPLVINLTGSVWFFLLVGKHELSLTVPLANSSAFLFTVLGEWYVERKVIRKETWLGMALVLGGIALCVHSKNQVVASS